MFTTQNTTTLTRSELWSSMLKDVLHDDLMGTNWVDMIVDFPDGDVFTIPSIGDAQVDDYTEDTEVIFRPMDTGEFQFVIDEYISSGHYITRKAEQDMFYSQQLVSSFIPKERRAIMEHFEVTLLQKPEDFYAENAQGQINNAFHRFAGGNGGKIELQDFAYAQYALKKANVPQQNLVAVVDPSVEFELNTLTNLTNVSDNPRWEGIVADGIASGMKFMKNVYGFDVYVSNYLPQVTDGALNERDGATAQDYSSDAGVANYFFSATSDILPWKAAWRQPPTVDSEWKMNKQRTEYLTTARYGTALYREDNLVTVVTDPAIS